MRSTQVVPLNSAPWSLRALGTSGWVGRALEDHVLEQVGHAGLAVAFVARADEDGQVDGDVGRRGIGEEQNAQAVVEAVFGDTFDGGDLFQRWGFLRLRRSRGKQESQAK